MEQSGKKLTSMVNPKILQSFLLVLLLGGCSSGSEDKIQSYFAVGSGVSPETLDRYLESKMGDLGIPGLSVAVINDGRIVYHRTMGYANREEKIPVTDSTIFEGASMSKSVFAFFVMKFVEEGKLGLDKPLHEYLPYPDIAHDDRYKKITARMVLSHRSGFPNWRENEENKTLKIHFEPGSDYLYSGEGYQYLAMVLKHIESTDWNGLEAMFQDKVASPLGLEHTVFIQTPYTSAHKAEPYDENNRWIDWRNSYWFSKAGKEFGAAYSIHSEPVDFSKWMIAVMNKELLREESYRQLFKPHSTIQSEGPVDVSYCLGFFTPEFPVIETDLFAHSGHNDGFTCMFALDTEKKWGFVIFTNSESGEPLGNAMLEYLLLGPDLTKVYLLGSALVLIILFAIGYAIRFILLKLETIRTKRAV